MNNQPNHISLNKKIGLEVIQSQPLYTGRVVDHTFVTAVSRFIEQLGSIIPEHDYRLSTSSELDNSQQMDAYELVYFG